MTHMDEMVELMKETIVVQDPIDLDKVVECTPIYIEQDGEFTFIYLKANEEQYNDKYEPKFGFNIYTVIEYAQLAQNKNCYIKYKD